MKQSEIEAFARKAAQGIKTEKDLCDFSRILKKVAVETALNAELDEHLGYDRHDQSNNINSRNGYSSKTIITEDGQFEVTIPRDRKGSFESQLVKKHQTRLTMMDIKLIVFMPKKSLLHLKKCMTRMFPPALFLK